MIVFVIFAIVLLWFAVQTKREDKGIYIMTTERDNIIKLIILSHSQIFTRKQRKLKGLNYHHINIIINLYLLQEIKGKNNITLTELLKTIDYFDYKVLRKIIANIIPDYVLYKDDKYYGLSFQGIVLVEDILSGYDSVFRTFMEKHKFNELF